MLHLLNRIGNIKIALWLILSMACLLLVGGVYSFNYYQFFNTLNSVPVQQWIIDQGLSRIHLIWWLLLFFITAFALAVNTTACTLSRMITIIKKRDNLSQKNFLLSLTPSIIHILFLLALTGHFLSSATNSPMRIPVTEGDSIEGPEKSIITINEITIDKFPGKSKLNKRIRQIKARIEIKRENLPAYQETIHFGSPATIGSHMIMLDMNKKNKMYHHGYKKVDDSCNKAPLYKIRQEADTPQLYLVIVQDIGLPVVLVAVVFIILLMCWYFWETKIRKKQVLSYNS